MSLGAGCHPKIKNSLHLVFPFSEILLTELGVDVDLPFANKFVSIVVAFVPHARAR